MDIFEQNLRTACQSLCDAQIPAPSSHAISPEHEEQMKALFSRRRRRLPLRIAAIAAAVAIAFATVWIRPPLANYSFSRDDSGVHVSWIKSSTAIAALRMPANRILPISNTLFPFFFIFHVLSLFSFASWLN